MKFGPVKKYANIARRLAIKAPELKLAGIPKNESTRIKTYLKTWALHDRRVKHSNRETGGGAVHIESGGSHYSQFR